MGLPQPSRAEIYRSNVLLTCCYVSAPGAASECGERGALWWKQQGQGQEVTESSVEAPPALRTGSPHIRKGLSAHTGNGGHSVTLALKQMDVAPGYAGLDAEAAQVLCKDTIQTQSDDPGDYTPSDTGAAGWRSVL